MSMAEAAGLVPVGAYADRRRIAPRDLTVFDNIGWGVVAGVGPQAIRLWASAYALRNGPAGPWPFAAASACQTTLIVGEHDEGAGDNDFVHVGWDPIDLLPASALTITSDDDHATWQVAGRRFTASRDAWVVHGSHAGVDLDLEFVPAAAPYWFRTAADFSGPAELWLNQLASARGFIVVSGTRHEINGYGWHEHHTHVRRSLDPLSLNSGDGLLFVAGFAGETSVYAHARPSRSEGHLVVRHGTGVTEFSGSELAITYRDWWHDPRSWFQVPRRYLIEAAGRGGRVSVDTSCHERAFYLWPYRDGSAQQYWFVARSECQLDVPEWGPPTTIELESMVNLNRAFYRRRVGDGLQVSSPSGRA